MLIFLMPPQWDDLSSSTRQLWSKLGWTAENWETGDGVETEGMAWNDLTEEQQQAALELSFDEAEWDDDDDGLDFHRE